MALDDMLGIDADIYWVNKMGDKILQLLIYWIEKQLKKLSSHQTRYIILNETVKHRVTKTTKHTYRHTF